MLTYEECVKVFDEARQLGCQSVNISGGEPLMHPDIYRIIAYTSQYCYTSLLTNGYIIDDEVAKKLTETGLHMAQISLDSSVPEKHNELRASEQAFARIERACSVLRQYGIRVCFMTTLSKRNKEEFSDILKLASDMGISFVNFRRLIPQGRGCDNFNELGLSRSEISDILEQAKELEADYEIGICLFPFYPFRSSEMRQVYRENTMHTPESGCSAGVSGLAIASDGSILLCPHIPKALGNIRETPLYKIWFENEVILQLRDREKNLGGSCGNCEFKNACGGCRAYPYQETGDLLGEDTLCFINT